jgi:hypothetical protein
MTINKVPPVMLSAEGSLRDSSRFAQHDKNHELA